MVFFVLPESVWNDDSHKIDIMGLHKKGNVFRSYSNFFKMFRISSYNLSWNSRMNQVLIILKWLLSQRIRIEYKFKWTNLNIKVLYFSIGSPREALTKSIFCQLINILIFLHELKMWLRNICNRLANCLSIK